MDANGKNCRIILQTGMDSWGWGGVGNNRGHFLQTVCPFVLCLLGAGRGNKLESNSLSSLYRKSALPQEAMSVQVPTE